MHEDVLATLADGLVQRREFGDVDRSVPVRVLLVFIYSALKMDTLAAGLFPLALGIQLRRVTWLNHYYCDIVRFGPLNDCVVLAAKGPLGEPAGLRCTSFESPH